MTIFRDKAKFGENTCFDSYQYRIRCYILTKLVKIDTLMVLYAD
jgi:hypothetical protein